MAKRITWAWFFGAKQYSVKNYGGLNVDHTIVPHGFWRPLSMMGDDRDRRAHVYHWREYIKNELNKINHDRRNT